MQISLTLFITFFPWFILLLYLNQIFFSKTKPQTSKIPISRFKNYPILGTIPDLVANHHRVYEWSTQLLSSHPTHTSTFYRPVGGTHGVLTAHPANVEHILKTRFENYPKGPRFLSILDDFLGHGIFNADGPEWRMQRKTASFAFNMRTLRNFLLISVQFEITSRLTPILNDAMCSNRVIDMQNILQRFTFDTICKLAFNVDPCCLNQQTAAGSSELEFMQAFDIATEISLGRFLYAFPWWKIKRIFSFGSEKILKKAVENVHDFADKIIKSRLEENLSKKDNYVDLLSRFIDTIDDDNHNNPKLITSKFLRDVVISVILAGRDTSSASVTWLIWLLSFHSEVVEKIRYEIDQIRVQSKKSVGCGFEYEELSSKMHYLQAVISESLRLYPPVPVDTKACLEDDVLPDGTTVKGGWFVMYHIYAMGRMRDIWGDDCYEFKPDRWIENGVYKPENPFKNPVFHAGPRLCLGREMAFLQMKSIVASVVEQFDVQVVGKEKNRLDYQLSLTLRMKDGLAVKIKKRNDRLV